jgi:surface antigen
MSKKLINVIWVAVCTVMLAACSNMMSQNPSGAGSKAVAEGQPQELSGAPVDSGPLVGSVAMDGIDKSKLSHALDVGIGRTTHWKNGSSGIAYSVTPTRKVSVGDNNLCRAYTVTAQRGGSTQQTSGTACVGSDGMWHPV